uniref:DAP3-binding cell death enhancer 1-like isoform X1 n=1 Tax=Myxine glutinosa TaxID=7769 RepID=UPI00358F2FBF
MLRACKLLRNIKGLRHTHDSTPPPRPTLQQADAKAGVEEFGCQGVTDVTRFWSLSCGELSGSTWNGKHNKQRKDHTSNTNAYYYARPCFLDAFGLGAIVAVGFQGARRFHLLFSERHERAQLNVPCLYRVAEVALGHQALGLIGVHHVLPKQDASQPTFSLTSLPPRVADKSSSDISEAESVSEQFEEGSTSGFTAEDLLEEDASTEELEMLLEQNLNSAAANLQSVHNSSLPTVLNIMGLHTMKAGDPKVAFRHFSEAAQHGYAKAQYNLALCYETGQGVIKDEQKAALLFARAAVQGHSAAQYNLALYFLSQHPPREQVAQQLLEQAADNGLVNAQSYLGVFFTKPPHQDYKKAVKYLTLAAHNKDVTSMYHLGVCYERGHGLAVDLQKARECFEDAANEGHADALYNLAIFHQHGLGVKPSHGTPGHSLHASASAPTLSRVAGQDAWCSTIENVSRASSGDGLHEATVGMGLGTGSGVGTVLVGGTCGLAASCC